MKNLSERITAVDFSAVHGEIDERTTANISLPVFSCRDICDDDAFHESVRLNRFVEKLASILYGGILSADDSDACRISYAVNVSADISNKRITLKIRAAEYHPYRRSREAKKSARRVVTMAIELIYGHAVSSRILSVSQ